MLPEIMRMPGNQNKTCIEIPGNLTKGTIKLKKKTRLSDEIRRYK